MEWQFLLKIFQHQINAIQFTRCPIQVLSLLHQQISSYLVICSIILYNLDRILFPNLLNNFIHHLDNFFCCFTYFKSINSLQKGSSLKTISQNFDYSPPSPIYSSIKKASCCFPTASMFFQSFINLFNLLLRIFDSNFMVGWWLKSLM